MAENFYYHDRFQCPDPVAKEAVSRSTRHRILKKRKCTESNTLVEISEADDGCEAEDMNVGVVSGRTGR